MTDRLPPKSPAERLDYLIKTAGLLEDGESIVQGQSSITVTGGIKDSEAFGDEGVTVWVRGGTIGTLIAITALLKTSGGRTYERRCIIPYLEPVGLELAKKQCRIEADVTDDDELIAGYIIAAREFVEWATGHVLVPRAQQAWFASFEKAEIYRTPVTSIDNVTYFDADEVEQAYEEPIVRLGNPPARIYPRAGEGQWPAISPHGGVKVTWTGGYGDGEAPQQAIQAMLMLIAHWYRNREAVITGGIAANIPQGAHDLCRQIKLMRV